MTKNQIVTKLAYNFLFRAHINDETLEQTIKGYDTSKILKGNSRLLKYENEVKEVIKNNHAKYLLKPFIASSYEQIEKSFM
jgi:hypothetical protein